MNSLVFKDSRLLGATQILRGSGVIYVLSPVTRRIVRISTSTWTVEAMTLALPTTPLATALVDGVLYVVGATMLLALDATALTTTWTAHGMFVGVLAGIAGGPIFVAGNSGQIIAYNTSGVKLYECYLPFSRIQAIVLADATPTLLVADGYGRVAVVQIRPTEFIVRDVLTVVQLVDIRAVRASGPTVDFVVADREGNGSLVTCDVSDPTAPVFTSPNYEWSPEGLQSFAESTPATLDDPGIFATPWWYRSSDVLEDVVAWAWFGGLWLNPAGVTNPMQWNDPERRANVARVPVVVPPVPALLAIAFLSSTGVVGFESPVPAWALADVPLIGTGIFATVWNPTAGTAGEWWSYDETQIYKTVDGTTFATALSAGLGVPVIDMLRLQSGSWVAIVDDPSDPIRTSNDGVNWVATGDGIGYHFLFLVQHPVTGRIYTVSDGSNGEPLGYRFWCNTTDGVTPWDHMVSPPCPAGLFSSLFAEPSGAVMLLNIDSGFASGINGWYSPDGDPSMSWTPITSPDSDASVTSCSVAFLSGTWYALSRRSDGSATIYASVDNGTSWSLAYTSSGPVSDIAPHDLIVLATDNVVASAALNVRSDGWGSAGLPTGPSQAVQVLQP